MKLNDAINRLIYLRDAEGCPGDTELIDADGFAVGGFSRRDFDEDDKELNFQAGEIAIEVDSLR